ncbi:MAG: 50S ribosomal protein L3 [Patescibacteria group bacterium]
MMKFILGTKIGMSQQFAENGDVVPVTIVQAGPCKVTQVKTKEKDSYSAIQIGFGKTKKITKAQKGHLKELEDFKVLKELPLDDDHGLKRGDIIDVSAFSVGDKVKVSGTSKGKGFQGVVRRHGFHGHPASHGHKDQLRMPGSIGASSFPSHVFKGKRMGGHMGNEKSSVLNLKIAEIDKEKNLLYLKGAVPGANNGLVIIYG